LAAAKCIARDGRSKSHVVELIEARAQTDFDVSQAISISQLREAHSQKLIPTREVADSIVALVALHTPPKLLGVNPLHDLRKNRLSGTHSASLALVLLAENTNPSPYRSHLQNANSPVFASGLDVCPIAKRDDSD
jgi:hypothetical protein